MLSALLPILECPHCRAGFHFQEVSPPACAAAEFGILRCRSHAFPVLDGIPVIQHAAVGMFEHTRGTAQVAGRSVAELVRLLERGAALEALLACLAVPQLPRLVQRALGWRLAHSGSVAAAARALGERRFRTRVLSRRADLSARELFEFYYRPGGPLDPELGHYFVLRFGQPRHLAALAVAATLPALPKPVLDIACGAGHLDHYLTQRPAPCRVVGLDMNFYHLWIARHWIAPQADFVCANAGDALPFAAGAFAAAFCSDAYHYIPGRVGLLAEIARCASGGPSVLTRVGNQAVPPNEGAEQTVEGYLGELGPVRPRILAEQALVRCYLARANPLQEAPAEPAGLAACKWLSFVWNEPPAQPAPASWPHAVGELTLNPIYSVTGVSGSQLRLQLQFPSTHYRAENEGMLDYHPVEASLDRALLETAAAAAPDAADIRRLVDSFVLLGAPRRFAPAASLRIQLPA